MNFFENLNPNHIPVHLQGKDEISIQREITLQYILSVVASLGFIGLVIWVIAGGYRQPILLAELCVVFVWVVFVLVNRKLPYWLRALTMVALSFLEPFINLTSNGLQSDPTNFEITCIILVAIFFGSRIGVAVLSFAILSNSLVGFLTVSRIISAPMVSAPLALTNPASWIPNIIAVIISGGSIIGALYRLTRGFTKSLSDQKEITRKVDQERSSLASQSMELTRIVAKVDVSRRVALKIAVETETDSILNVAVNVIREQFNYYHAGIFLLDRSGENAILTSATGEAGKKMLQKGHVLRVNSDSIVGYVVKTGESRIAGNVDQDPVHYKNPFLPDTRSEMAIPLIASNKIVGVLDVQSSIRDAFSSEDIEIILSLANQVASALERARLTDKLRQSLIDAEEVHRETTRTAWHKHLKNSRHHFAYQYKMSQVESLDRPSVPLDTSMGKQEDGTWIPQMPLTQAAPAASGAESTNTMRVPIKLHNQVLGMVNLRFSTPTISEDMRHLVEGAIERMAQSLENARLLEEIQVRAERERMVGDISNKVRSVTDVESILRIAAGELGHSLGVSEVVVQLTAKD